MGRPKALKNSELPKHLYTLERGGRLYYSYKSPITGRSLSIGYDRENAIRYAEEANVAVAAVAQAKTHSRQSIKHGSVDERGLLDGHSIARRATFYDHVCGVYFLLSQGAIVYVGQSKNVLGRIATHRAEGEKRFDRVFVVECKASELDHLEALYIDKFCPIYNTVRPYVDPTACAWDASLASILGDGCIENSSD
ncbi:phage integrase Arm DNA-binding domain-containing protein [Burkholderia gladioli]|uniref:phage integrase Arm DNA-binding domain-containing protein n=1 Tax=Burkholderia gladioli TaxID=28095 RepID=UPI00163F8C4A|nr:phage integrase Arm DNA-binding domain-containing protein [Burkholderia gladioli]